MPAFKPLKPLKPSAAASTKPSGRQPLLLQGCSLPFACTSKTLRGSFHQALWPSPFAAPGLQPALCLHIPRGSFHQALGRQRSSIAACPLPAHSPLLLGHSSLPFASLQTLKTPKTLRGSFHQALWPSAFAAPGLQPALCLHIPRGSFHQAPGRQRSSIAACPLPAHSPLLLGHSSLPFASLQTLKTPKTLRGSFHQALWPSAFAPPGLQPALCLHIPRGSFHQAPGRQRSSIAACPLPAHSPLLLGIRACRLPAFKPLKPLKPSAAASTKPSGRQPLLLQGCSLPFACTSLAAASTKLLAVSVPALQPAFCLHIALSC